MYSMCIQGTLQTDGRTDKNNPKKGCVTLKISDNLIFLSQKGEMSLGATAPKQLYLLINI